MYIQFRSIMPNNARLSKWGNSLAVRIPRAIVKEAWLAEGDWLSLDLAGNGSIVLRSRDREYSLGQLVAGIKPHNRHGETAYPQRYQAASKRLAPERGVRIRARVHLSPGLCGEYTVCGLPLCITPL